MCFQRRYYYYSIKTTVSTAFPHTYKYIVNQETPSYIKASQDIIKITTQEMCCGNTMLWMIILLLCYHTNKPLYQNEIINHMLWLLTLLLFSCLWDYHTCSVPRSHTTQICCTLLQLNWEKTGENLLLFGEHAPCFLEQK